MADGYNSFNGSAIGGTSWGSGNAYLAFEHKSNSYLLASDRDYTNQNLVSVGGRDSRATACALPNIRVGNTWYAQTGYPDGTPGSLAANLSGGLSAPDPVTNAGQMNRCDTNAVQALYPKQEQNSVFGSLHQTISDGIDFDATVLWSNRLDSQLQPTSSVSMTVNNTNPYFQSIAGETSQTVMFDFSPFLGNKARVNWNNSEVFQFTPKLTIQLPYKDWDVVLQGNYGRSFSNGMTWGYNSNVTSTALSQQTIGGVLSPNLVASSGPVGNALDPYNINLSNPTLLNQIVDVGNIGKAVQHVIQYGATANGTLFTLPGGDVKAAVGTRYSWDDYIAQWFINTPIGQMPGTYAPVPGTQDAVAKTHRTTMSGFGEIIVPLVSASNKMPFVDDFSIDISGRIDNYSDFGETDNYKLGFTWDPFESLTIRGTKGTSYDAPSLADTLAPDGRFIYQVHATPNTTVPPGTSAADALRPSIFIPGGNPNLGPELGSTWSLGADFHPTTEFGVDLTGLDISITRYHIFIEDQIGLTPFNSPLLFQIPQYAQYYIINPTPAQVASYGYNTFINFPAPNIASIYPPNVPADQSPYILVSAERNNIGNALLEGFDFSAKYSMDVENFGNVTVGTSGTVSTKDATNAVQGSPWNSIQTYGAPLYAMNLFAQVATGPLSGRLSMNYSPGFRVNPGTLSYKLYNQTRMGSFHPVNLYVAYDLDNVASWGSGARVGLTINNIGDEDPPIYLEGGNATTTNGGQRITGNGSTLGRYFVLSLQKKF
jgi:iron complex outermembrane receptor protein